MYEWYILVLLIRLFVVSFFFRIYWWFLFQVIRLNTKKLEWKFSLVRDVIHLVLQANPCHLKFDQIENLLRDSVCYSSRRKCFKHFYLDWGYRQYPWTSYLAFNPTENISNSSYRIQYNRRYYNKIWRYLFYLSNTSDRSCNNSTGIFIGEVFYFDEIFECVLFFLLADGWNWNIGMPLSMRNE